MTIHIRAGWRLLRLMWHVARGFFILLRYFPRWSPLQKNKAVQAWALDLIAHAAIDLKVSGAPPRTTPTLVVANHISWLDVFVILAICPCRFVAKSEVRRWPLIGTLADATDTLFIERQSARDALRVVHLMTERLRQGETLLIFPEGTTSNGLQVLPFHGNLFQAAISSEVSVQAVALQYQNADTQQPSLAPSFIGDDTLFGSIWRTLSAPALRVTVSFAAPINALGLDRRRLADDVRQSIVQLL